jgi:hypothetical protein
MIRFQSILLSSFISFIVLRYILERNQNLFWKG